MANTRFQYVKGFEQSTERLLLPQCYVVVRVDGKGFHKFTSDHKYKRPSDERGLRLMNKAAVSVMNLFPDITCAYGHSDEFSFMLDPRSQLFNRRAGKIETLIASSFCGAFVFYWNDNDCFGSDMKMQFPPAFDARAIEYPRYEIARDYLKWRQADAHINNLYNTVFHALVDRSGMTPDEGRKRLSTTNSGEKNEILFQQFGINYNNEPAINRKGTFIFRDTPKLVESCSSKKRKKENTHAQANISTAGEAQVADLPSSFPEEEASMKRNSFLEHAKISNEEWTRSNNGKYILYHDDLFADLLYDTFPWILPKI